MKTFKEYISEETDEPIGYHIVHNKTQAIVGKAKTRAGASKVLDRKDNAYGGYIHRIVPIYKKDEGK